MSSIFQYIRIMLIIVIILIVLIFTIGYDYNLNVVNNLFSQKKTLQQDSSTKSFIFHSGRNSVGGDILKLKNESVEGIRKTCQAMKDCVGFTSDGYLKRQILPYSMWTNVKMNNDSGLYVSDVDYCTSVDSEDRHHHMCTKGSYCVSKSKGTYSCADLSSHINLVLSINSLMLNGTLALLQSIKMHSTPNRSMMIIIHIVVSTKDRKLLESQITCNIIMPQNIQIEFHSFDLPLTFKRLIRSKHKKYLTSTANFARFMFDRVFPSLPYILYVDADTIVRHDLSDLWKEVINNEHLFAAVPRDSPTYKSHFKSKINVLFEKRYGKKLNGSTTAFNAGLLGINLKKWRRNGVINEIKYWMKQHSKQILWIQATQPLILLVGYDDWKHLDKRWNVNGLGATGIKRTKEELNSAYLLHWNGLNKPWAYIDISNKATHVKRKKKKNPYNYLWYKYMVKECSGRGKCVYVAGTENSVCNCNIGFEGQFCEIIS